MSVVHRGVGVDDPDLEVNFDDPIHLTYSVLPSTYEELERMENERHARISGASLSSNSASENHGTTKRKNNKKHKMPTKEDKVYDSSSSTSVENMEEGGGELPSVLHPESKKLADMEQKVSYLAGVVASMTERLLHCMENQTTANNNTQSLITLCQDQASAIRSLQNLTGNIQHRLSEVEEASDANMRRVAVVTDSVMRLDKNYDNLKRESNRMGEQIQQMAASAAVDGASYTGAADSCETGILLSGIQDFREIFDMHPTADPVNVAARLMSEIGSYGVISRIHVADRAVEKKEDRYKARAVIIYLNTLFHKKQAIVELKKFLQQNPGLRAAVSDVFPADETPRAIALNRYAAKKRQDKSMTRTRVINKGGTAVLQHTEGRSKKYKDSVVTESELEPFFQARPGGEGGERGGQVDRRRSNRDERELRDQERASQRGNNNDNTSGDCPSSNINQGQHQQQQQLPQRTQRTNRKRGGASPPLRISTPNNQPLGPQQIPSVSMPRGHQQQQHPHPQQLPLHSQKQPYTPATQQQQPQQSDTQQTHYHNSIPAGQSQWIQGASGPAQHGLIQVPQSLLPYIRQQLY
jgi:hypothetical protein